MSFTSIEPSTPRLHRSELAVPGSNTALFEKAAQSAADIVFLDVEDAVARRRSAEVRRATRRSGARSLAAACGRVHEVAWDAVEELGAHGLTAGYHEITVEDTTGLRQGGLDLVRADDVLGDHLRGTLLRS